jgi:D-serine deaminase-like pyridoxal phosphate-dependent protein
MPGAESRGAMERVRITDYGVDIVFGGPLTREEAAELLAELDRKLPPPGGHFGLLVDSRRSRAYSAAEQAIFKRGILLCVERGMERSVVVHDSHISTLQAKRLGKETGTLAWTRYIDARSHPDWQRIAEDWLRHGIDPELT